MRHCAKLNIDEIPDETTILKFRLLMEKHQLGAVLFEAINAELEDEGLLLKTGTLVDATFINASAKNKMKARYPEMRSGKKGNTRHVGKLHIGRTNRQKLSAKAQELNARAEELRNISLALRHIADCPEDDFFDCESFVTYLSAKGLLGDNDNH